MGKLGVTRQPGHFQFINRGGGGLCPVVHRNIVERETGSGRMEKKEVYLSIVLERVPMKPK